MASDGDADLRFPFATTPCRRPWHFSLRNRNFDTEWRSSLTTRPTGTNTSRVWGGPPAFLPLKRLWYRLASQLSPDWIARISSLFPVRSKHSPQLGAEPRWLSGRM